MKRIERTQIDRVTEASMPEMKLPKRHHYDMLGSSDSYYVNYKMVRGIRKNPERTGYHKREKMNIREL